jgi:hypothetical protein
MTGTIAKTRPKSRSHPTTPKIREVCLIGSLRRTYVHLRPGGLGTEDSGLRKAEKAESG